MPDPPTWQPGRRCRVPAQTTDSVLRALHRIPAEVECGAGGFLHTTKQLWGHRLGVPQPDIIPTLSVYCSHSLRAHGGGDSIPPGRPARPRRQSPAQVVTPCASEWLVQVRGSSDAFLGSLNVQGRLTAHREASHLLGYQFSLKGVYYKRKITWKQPEGREAQGQVWGRGAGLPPSAGACTPRISPHLQAPTSLEAPCTSTLSGVCGAFITYA